MAKPQDRTEEKSETALREENILTLWREKGVFEASLHKEAPEGDFVFYDGPPFATGLPHMGSLLSSVIKDVVPRYKTMRGYRVARRWGWDCHGLPIESLIEKRLNLKTKKDIEQVGVEVFNEAARASVLEFEQEWEKYVERIGRWVDFRNSYKTMDNSYIESVWWALKSLHEKGLLYEGKKVLMYCTHCETPLAKAEIAMDNTYKDVTDEAVTVKFKVKNPEKLGLSGDVYLLAWTTTPWTLPGNVALAVGEGIEYGQIRKLGQAIVPNPIPGNYETDLNEDTYIVAKDTLGIMNPATDRLSITPEKLFKGEDLIGLEYEPLFDVPELKSDTSYKVYAADFVNTEEGTGIVHTAVMYGEDDFLLGQRENLPMVQMLDNAGHYNGHAPEHLRGEYYKKANKLILEDLEKRGLVFARAAHTHSYPHCYRCGTPLIYNAVGSWFINIQKIKEKLLSENEKIRWVPEHLKEGRFRHIVENAPDWTISRNRFWASPLPIWKSKDGDTLVVGSLEELKKRVKKSGNRYFLMRHGEATHMVKNVVSDDKDGEYPLTETGREQVRGAVSHIPRDKPIVIISSPVLRARQSAEILAKELGVDADSIRFDERLAELRFGVFDGKPYPEYKKMHQRPDWYTVRPKGGENFEDAKKRFGEALYEYEAEYHNSTVVISTHAIAFDSLLPICEGVRGDNLLNVVGSINTLPGEVRELPFVPLPLNAKFELDLHRPYIDSLVLLGDDGREYERIPEVVDCWVESGAMPFAELHYPFSGEEEFEKRSPADFIAEYIAQTRTWFYYLHAMSVGLFGRLAFRNVVSTGTILAADGSKMSKSKGNYTDPLLLMNRYGADAVRLSLMGSVVMQGEDLSFRDEDVREAHNRTIGILWNSYKFFELYRGKCESGVQSADSPHPLDRWVRSRLGETMRDMTDAFEAYDTPKACRTLRAFVEDYSTWYVRRSRDRVRADVQNIEDMQHCLATQRDVLSMFAKLAAPLMPFIAESIYQGVRREDEPESVHLCSWPEAPAVDEEILSDMKMAREVASRGLQLRDDAGIRVRQPLSRLEAKELPKEEAVRRLIAEEVNVMSVEENASLEEDVRLDIELTDELREAGWLRETVRAVQAKRKEKGYSIEDRPALLIHAPSKDAGLLRTYAERIVSDTGVSGMHVEEAEEFSVELL